MVNYLKSMIYVPSLSSIITVAVAGVPIVSWGVVDSISTVKSCTPSSESSSKMVMFSQARVPLVVVSAKNVTSSGNVAL